jgi:hypothetical protein
MKRRNLLVGVGILGASGYGYTRWSAKSPQDGTGPPQFIGDEYAFTGQGQTVTEQFSIENNGPTAIEISHVGQGEFYVELDNRSRGRVVPLLEAKGDYATTQFVTVPTDNYTLRVRRSPAEWSITVRDFYVYNENHEQVGTLPIEAAGKHNDVIGPLSFDSLTDTEFKFIVNGEGRHEVSLYDERGVYINDLFNLETADTATENFDVRLNGIGYLIIRSAGDWQLNAEYR